MQQFEQHQFITTARLTILLVALLLCLLFGQQMHAADADSIEQDEQSNVERSQRYSEQKALFDQQIATLETEVGPFDNALAEPLQSLTALHIEAGDFTEADSVLKRRLQLSRFVDGPEGLEQIEILEELIANNIRRSQWQDVTENFENIQLIRTQNPNTAISIVLDAMSTTRNWYLTAIYVDDPILRIDYYHSARELQRQMLRLAEERYSEDSPELIPWLYSNALQKYQTATFITSRDELGADARDQISRPLAKSPVNFLREGLDMAKRIRSIVETQNDLEAEAMSMIYEADYQMLLQLGTARRLYRRAMDKLEEAGIDPQRITEFFERPIVLPEPIFYTSIDEAIDAQTAYGYTVTPADDGEQIHMGEYIAWNESLPYARRPQIPDEASSIATELYVVEVEFNISSQGEVRTPDAQWADPDVVRVRRDAQDAIEDMQFRPRFYDGRWRRVRDVTMRYLYPPKL
jgi:hypothetical protein